MAGFWSKSQKAIPVFFADDDGLPMGGVGTPLVVSATQAGATTLEEQRVFDGFGYTVSTQIVTVPTGNAFVAELSNPAVSGVNYIMTARVFSANMALQYRRYANTATVPTGGTTVPISNRISGGAASTGTFRYIVSGTPATGTVSSAGFVPADYQEKRIKDIVIIAPGNRLIYNIGGSGGGLNGTEAICGMTFLFYTRAI